MVVTPEQLKAFQRFFTPLVSDVMDRLGLPNPVIHRDIQSIPFDPDLKVAGLAYPCRVTPTTEYVEIGTLLEMVDSIPQHAFVLVAADQDIDAALWGGLMSTRANARGAVAAAVNGGVRDFQQVAKLEFPVFGAYRCIKDIRRRGYMAAYNTAVEFGGQRIEPGDVMFGDANGLVVIKTEYFTQVYGELMVAIGGEEKTAEGLERGKSAQALFNEFKTF